MQTTPRHYHVRRDVQCEKHLFNIRRYLHNHNEIVTYITRVGESIRCEQKIFKQFVQFTVNGNGPFTLPHKCFVNAQCSLVNSFDQHLLPLGGSRLFALPGLRYRGNAGRRQADQHRHRNQFRSHLYYHPAVS